MIITIDGPAGSGKGTTAKLVAERLKIVHLDTGSIYRLVTYYLTKLSIRPDEIEKITAALNTVSICLENNSPVEKKFLISNQEIPESELRTSEISQIVAKYARVKEIREFVKTIQKNFINKHKDIIVEGRDIGSEICPNAELKVYLTADLETRAKRRYLELKNKLPGVTYEQVLADIKERDQEDMNREISPLRIPEGAKVLDNTNLTIDQQVDIICNWYKEIKSEIN